MQLFDRGGQLVSRPSPNSTISPGWANNDLTQTTPPTIGDPDWANAVTAEVLAFLVQTGLTASKTNVTQMLQAVMRIAGGNVTTVTAATQTLTADNAGLVLVDAASNNVAITLPASASASAQMLKFRFVRTDSTTNTVSIAFYSGDTTLIGGMSGPLSLSPLAPLTLVGDGTTHWVVMPAPGVAIFAAGTTNFTVPPGVTLVEVTVTGGGGGSGSCAAGQGAGGGGAGGTAVKNCTVTPGQVIAVTVGAGGAAGVGSAGGTGGTSSFGTYCSALGGGFGSQSGAANSAGGTGGTGLSGDINIVGGAGTDGQTSGSFSFGGNGGSSWWGGGGRGEAGGGSPAAGAALGSGAGGSYLSAANGQSGAAGIVVVRWR